MWCKWFGCVHCSALKFTELVFNQGDSGGPLAHDEYGVVGVVSYGTRICSMGEPDVFTRVSKFKEWIAENCAD